MIGHKRSDVVEDCANFLKKIEKLKLDMVEFYDNGIIKPKIYPSNCIVEGKNCELIIIITYNECK